MKSLTLSSPAKVNLFLKIIRRLPNGYHELLTLFHRISLRDTLRLTATQKDIQIRCNQPALSLGADNLITRAYRLLQKEFPKLGGVSVRLTKKIPMGGGLGGGSSNAGTFLLGMKKLYRLPLSNQKLTRLAAQLGADCAFFAQGVNQAIGEGVGEKLRPLPSKKKHWFVLILGEQGLSTKQVYQALPKKLPGVSLTKQKRVVKILAHFLEHQDYPSTVRLLRNDLEAPAFCLRPSIQKTIQEIQSLGVPLVLMSGSGSTVFVMVDSQRAAQILKKKLQRVLRKRQIVVCHTY